MKSRVNSNARRAERTARGGLVGGDASAAAFFRWFHEDVMHFDALAYRRQFWRTASRTGRTIGRRPRTLIEFADPRLHPYNEWLANLFAVLLVMGAAATIWCLVKTVEAHVRRLRRPTYYDSEHARRHDLARTHSRRRRRRTLNHCPSPDALRAAFQRARHSPADMVRFGALLEDLECYVDNSAIWDVEHERFAGRRGGIRAWLRDNLPDLSERYKTIMRYKVLARKLRQAVGIDDPIPATAILPQQSAAIRKTNQTTARQCVYADKALLDRASHIVQAILADCDGTFAGLWAQLAFCAANDSDTLQRSPQDHTWRRKESKRLCA